MGERLPTLGGGPRLARGPCGGAVMVAPPWVTPGPSGTGQVPSGSAVRDGHRQHAAGGWAARGGTAGDVRGTSQIPVPGETARPAAEDAARGLGYPRLERLPERRDVSRAWSGSRSAATFPAPNRAAQRTSMTPVSGSHIRCAWRPAGGGMDDPVGGRRFGPVIGRVRGDRDVPPPLHPGKVRPGAGAPGQLADGDPAVADEPHAGRPHRHRHQPRDFVLAWRPAVAGRPVRHLLFELVVKLDDERHEHLARGAPTAGVAPLRCPCQPSGVPLPRPCSCCYRVCLARGLHSRHGRTVAAAHGQRAHIWQAFGGRGI